MGIAVLNFNNIILLILTQTIIFSLVTYPAFCGLFKKNLLACFNRNYLNCIIHGLYIFSNTIIYGTTLMAIFILINNITPSNFKFLITIVGGINSTIWLLHLTSMAFIPLWPNKKLKECIKLSKQAAKNNRIELFKLMLKTYINLITVVLIPHATKTYTKKIKALWQATKIQQTKKYEPTQKNA